MSDISKFVTKKTVEGPETFKTTDWDGEVISKHPLQGNMMSILQNTINIQ